MTKNSQPLPSSRIGARRAAGIGLLLLVLTWAGSVLLAWLWAGSGNGWVVSGGALVIQILWSTLPVLAAILVAWWIWVEVQPAPTTTSTPYGGDDDAPQTA
ncbi:MAG: hypothetical protein LBV06_08430 [Propionibacteriaceae bacterium]|jgi:4-hydroxybenzoate polyprenyltransferase|nr:hypothetical protein [Propionibacteriaceae bacterium]